jgi:hypothetical protein
VLERDASPRELFVECAGTVFSLIMTPKDVPAQTIILKSDVKNLEKAEKYETASNYEEIIFNLIKSAYQGVAPDGYDVKPLTFNKEFEEVSLEGLKQYKGAGYDIYEVKVTAKTAINLHEAAFLPYFPGVVAITIVNPTLFEGDHTRLIAVVRKS